MEDPIISSSILQKLKARTISQVLTDCSTSTTTVGCCSRCWSWTSSLCYDDGVDFHDDWDSDDVNDEEEDDYDDCERG